LRILLDKRGRKAEAEESIRRVAEVRGSLTKDFPNTPYHFEKLAGALAALATHAADRGSLAEAGRLQEQATAALRAAVALAPASADFRRRLASVCTDRAQTLIALRDHDEATRVAVELAAVSPDSVPEIVRAAAFVARCVPLAAGDSKLPESGRAQRAEAYARQAVDFLRQATKKGFRDANAVRNDRNFDSLRNRPDFGALLASLYPIPTKVSP
jgi:tetratricopeptide (TPR) repeat protein